MPLYILSRMCEFRCIFSNFVIVICPIHMRHEGENEASYLTLTRGKRVARKTCGEQPSSRLSICRASACFTSTIASRVAVRADTIVIIAQRRGCRDMANNRSYISISAWKKSNPVEDKKGPNCNAGQWKRRCYIYGTEHVPFRGKWHVCLSPFLANLTITMTPFSRGGETETHVPRRSSFSSRPSSRWGPTSSSAAAPHPPRATESPAAAAVSPSSRTAPPRPSRRCAHRRRKRGRARSTRALTLLRLQLRQPAQNSLLA